MGSESKQNKNTPTSYIFLLTELQSDNLFFKIWSLLGWYLFWFPWRAQLCLRKTCGLTTFTINYFYAYHMYLEQQRKSPLWGSFQKDDPYPFQLTVSHALALELLWPLLKLQNYLTGVMQKRIMLSIPDGSERVWGDKISPWNTLFAQQKNWSQHLQWR